MFHRLSMTHSPLQFLLAHENMWFQRIGAHMSGTLASGYQKEVKVRYLDMTKTFSIQYTRSRL